MPKAVTKRDKKLRQHLSSSSSTEDATTVLTMDEFEKQESVISPYVQISIHGSFGDHRQFQSRSVSKFLFHSFCHSKMTEFYIEKILNKKMFVDNEFSRIEIL